MSRTVTFNRCTEFRSKAVDVNVRGYSLKTQHIWRAAHDGRHDACVCYRSMPFDSLHGIKAVSGKRFYSSARGLIRPNTGEFRTSFQKCFSRVHSENLVTSIM